MALSNEAKQVIEEEWYPKGSSLATDRKIQAQTVFKPNQVDQWLKKGINRSDLQGYDTPDAREPSFKAIRSALHSSQTLGYVESEPDRFMHDRQQTRRLLEGVKDKVVDYRSFKIAVDEAWSKDKSLKFLVKNMLESDYEALFKTPKVQQWLKSNTSTALIAGLMRRFSVDRDRAQAIYERMNEDSRNKLLAAFMHSRPLRVAPRIEPEPMPRTPSVPLITQRSRSGRSYSRSKPIKWSDMELEFLHNNRQMPLRTLTDLHNNTFSTRRTLSSIKSRRLRLSPPAAG